MHHQFFPILWLWELIDYIKKYTHDNTSNYTYYDMIYIEPFEEGERRTNEQVKFIDEAFERFDRVYEENEQIYREDHEKLLRKIHLIKRCSEMRAEKTRQLLINP
jgi:hypothetical protein